MLKKSKNNLTILPVENEKTTMPDYDVNTIIKDLLDQNWDTTNVDKPSIIIKNNQSRRIPANESTVALHTTELDRTRITQSGNYRSESVVRCELFNSRSTVTPELEEIIRIVEDNDGSQYDNGLRGNWDVLEYDDIEVRDLDFGSFDAVIDIRLISYTE